MTEEKVSIKKNFMYQMVYQILLIILPFVTSPYIARVIGASGLGEYSFSYSIAYYFLLFANLGIQNYGNRTIAQCKDDSTQLSITFSNLASMHIVVSLISTFLYLFYVLFLASNKLIALIQTVMVIGALFDISWFYFGIEKFKLVSLRSTIIKILTVIAVFVFIRTADDLWKYCLIMSTGMLIGNLLLWVPLRKYVKIITPNLRDMFIHLKPLFILLIPAIAVSLYKYMDKIMIGCLGSNTQLGYYENAEKAGNVPTTIISSFGMVMLPRMSNLISKNDWDQISINIKKSMQFVMWMAFAFCFGMLGVSVDFATFFWGEEFITSGWIMIGLAVTIPFISFANVIRTQVLIPLKRDKEYIISVFIGAGINLIINYFLIPIWGAYGAVISTVLAEISVCVSQCFFVRREINSIKYLKDSLNFTIIGCIMLLIIILIRFIMPVSTARLIVAIIIPGFVYCILSIAYFKRIKANWIFDNFHSLVGKIR